MMDRTNMITRTMRAALLGTVALLGSHATAQEGSGFVISVNGQMLSGDPAIERQVERPDAQLAQADVRIQYDGLTVQPRLDLERVGDVSGGTVTLQSEMNYPAFVTRGEVRVYDARNRLISTTPIAPNGRATVQVPTDTGGTYFAVHRVYDQRGRFDETAPLPLSYDDGRDRADGVEEGTDLTARRGIPVYGGAVTVSGSDVPRGAQVTAMGETIRPDGYGGFAVQRIFPAGEYPIDVAVSGAGQNVNLVRDIEVPAADWFYVAVADLTYGVRTSDGLRETYNSGRFAGYLSGRFANGVELTAQADTGEGPLDQIFSDLDERDPRSVLLRVDPDDLYPTYGDDSTIVDDTPTSGRFYLRVERDNNFALWGDFNADVQGGYLRNERALYGLSGHWESQQVTDRGEARVSVDAYAAQPERLAQRDVLGATGGAVYFLNRQDIGIGTETLSVQVRDASTGRVLETRELVAGRDYSINYIQGVITLSAPLSSFGGDGGVIITDAGGANEVSLIANYEYSPTAGDVDTFAYGGRVEAWVSDDVRIGATGMVEDSGTAEQTAFGADILWQPTDTASVALDYAVSDGPGFSSSVSSDGGLVFNPTTGVAGRGEAYRLEVAAAMTDLGINREGSIGAYFEDRTEGFSTLDYNVEADETLWGVSATIAATERLDLAVYYDDYANADGEFDREGGIELAYDLTEALTIAAGVELLDRNDGTEAGSRTDAALRLTYAPNDDTAVYGYFQSTLERSGTLSDNDRYGVGGQIGFATDWTLSAEVSDGDQGLGARVLVSQERGVGHTTYIGYELDPDRELAGVTDPGRNEGRFVFGGTRDFDGGVAIFGENTYDMFGSYQSITSAYGLTYEVSDELVYSTALELGQVSDDVDGDYERRGISFGVSYSSEDLQAAARIEYRDEDGTLSGSARDSQTVLLVSDLRYDINEEQRLILSVDGATTSGDGTIVQDGNLIDVQVGYALRPVDNERLNALFRYRYLEDTYGEQLDNSDTPGALQRTHVLSAEASYDLTRDWTLGGKLGVRLSQTAADAGSPFAQNNAALAVVNARYHLLHNWDALVEVRAMQFEQTDTTEIGASGTIYRHLGDNLMLGVGYNFGSVSSDLTDIDYNETGAFINLVAQF